MSYDAWKTSSPDLDNYDTRETWACAECGADISEPEPGCPRCDEEIFLAELRRAVAEERRQWAEEWNSRCIHIERRETWQPSRSGLRTSTQTG